jgi:hypothetical protein
MRADSPARWSGKPSAIFARVADGDGVIVDSATAFYFGLNRTAAFLWELLQSRGSLSAGELARELEQKFEVSTLEAERDVAEFLARLVEHGLAVSVMGAQVGSRGG